MLTFATYRLNEYILSGGTMYVLYYPLYVYFQIFFKNTFKILKIQQPRPLKTTTTHFCLMVSNENLLPNINHILA